MTNLRSATRRVHVGRIVMSQMSSMTHLSPFTSTSRYFIPTSSSNGATNSTMSPCIRVFSVSVIRRIFIARFRCLQGFVQAYACAVGQSRNNIYAPARVQGALRAGSLNCPFEQQCISHHFLEFFPRCLERNSDVMDYGYFGIA